MEQDEPKIYRRVNKSRVAAMRGALEQEPRTYGELAQIADLNQSAVSRWVRRMHDEQKLHLASWAKDKSGRLFVPMFAWGRGNDAPRPGLRISPARRMFEHRLRKKAALKAVSETGGANG